MMVASNSLGFPLVSIIVFLPIAVAGLSLLIDSFVGEDSRRTVVLALVAAAVDFVLAVWLLVAFKLTPGPTGGPWLLQFSDSHYWIGLFGVRYWVGVDGFSVFLVPLTTLIVGLAMVAANFMIVERRSLYMLLMLSLETALLGVFVSANLFLFFVFWEAMLIPMYFLIGLWGEARRVYATFKFVVYTMAGSFLMLVGLFYLWAQTGTLDMPGPGGLVAHLAGHPLSISQQYWLFLAFGLAFAIKLPIFPFHTWAPSAYAESPIPTVIVLSGIMSKAGAFGLLRYSLPLFPHAARDLAGPVSILAIVGILYAAGLALVQQDIKRIVAYASISHVNLIALGIFSLNSIGFDGSVLQIVNHSVIITGLFLGVAYITSRTGSRMIRDLGGLGVHRPILMWLFFVFVLAGLDLPGLSSFAGEFLILLGTFRTNAWFASIAALVTIIAAWYMIRLFQDTMNGPIVAAPQQTAEYVEDTQRSVYEYPVVRRLLSGDLLPREIGLLVPLLALIVYIGIQPDPLTARIDQTANPVTTIVHSSGTTSTSPVGGGR